MCLGAVYGSDEYPVPFTMREAVGCYRRLVMSSFERINASWITYNANCNPEDFGWTVSDEHVKNLQETYMEVYSATKCTEKFPKM